MATADILRATYAVAGVPNRRRQHSQRLRRGVRKRQISRGQERGQAVSATVRNSANYTRPTHPALRGKTVRKCINCWYELAKMPAGGPLRESRSIDTDTENTVSGAFHGYRRPSTRVEQSTTNTRPLNNCITENQEESLALHRREDVKESRLDRHDSILTNIIYEVVDCVG